jgi:hypothetical protein
MSRKVIADRGGLDGGPDAGRVGGRVVGSGSELTSAIVPARAHRLSYGSFWPREHRW